MKKKTDKFILEIEIFKGATIVHICTLISNILISYEKINQKIDINLKENSNYYLVNVYANKFVKICMSIIKIWKRSLNIWTTIKWNLRINIDIIIIIKVISLDGMGKRIRIN